MIQHFKGNTEKYFFRHHKRKEKVKGMDNLPQHYLDYGFESFFATVLLVAEHA